MIRDSSTKQVVHIGINTDPFSLEDFHELNNGKSQSKLKTREDVDHIHITNSDILHESYNFGEILGQGSFGTVLAIGDKNDDKTWAMKIIPKTLVTTKMNVIKREIQILKMVTHPHIILLHRIFESNDRIYLVLDKCIGELGKVFKNSKPFSESDTKIVITQLVEVVDYLHKNDIVHRDLKLENILLAQNPENLDDTLYIKVTDFGLSIVKGAFHEMLHERCGTLAYLSPEILSKGSYSQQCDVWAMGIIMYLLLLGKFPFYAPVEDELINLICHEEPDYSNCSVSEAGLHLITKMLRKNPAQRITAAEAKIHAWIEGGPLDERKHRTVLEMMEMWRSDMMLQGTDCDWVTTKLDKNLETTTTDKDRLGVPSNKSGRRQSMKIPIHNIQFDRKRGGNDSTSTRRIDSKQPPYANDGKNTDPSPSTQKKSTRNFTKVNRS